MSKKMGTWNQDIYMLRNEEMAGWCTRCADWTRSGDVEGDAEGYECPVCGEHTVMGAEEWMLAHVG